MAKKDAQGNLHDDSNGRFTSKNGVSALEKKYNDDLPLNPKQQGLNGIQLTANEYVIVQKQFFEMQIRAKKEKREMPKYIFVSTSNNCYFLAVSNGNFSALQGFDIEEDWDRLKEWRDFYELE